MGTLDQKVPAVSPLTAAQLTDEINTELSELYKRSFARVGSLSGTNTYTGSVPLDRTLEDGNGFLMSVPNANTGPATFNGKALVSSEGAALQGGQLVTGQEIAFIYRAASDHYRILSPLAGGAAPIVRTYLAESSTWTKPGGLRYIKVRVQAPGGKGGGTSAGAGGGASGGYAEKTIAAADLPASVAVSIPAPETNGLVTAASASFGSFITCPGGNAGYSNAGGALPAAPTGGDINIRGQAGQPGASIATSPSFQVHGAGASSPMGQGGAQQFSSNLGAGREASGYGAGGAGGPGGGGGAGSPGIVIVEEFY